MLLPPRPRPVLLQLLPHRTELPNLPAGKQSESGAERPGRREEVEIAALQAVEGFQRGGPAGGGAEYDSGAGGAGQTGHHRRQTGGAVCGEVGQLENRTGRLLAHQLLPGCDLRRGDHVPARTGTHLHPQLLTGNRSHALGRESPLYWKILKIKLFYV